MPPALEELSQAALGFWGRCAVTSGYLGVMAQLKHVHRPGSSLERASAGFHRALAVLTVKPAGFIAWQRKEFPECITVASF